VRHYALVLRKYTEALRSNTEKVQRH
jgi:hypothetical protein